MIRTVSFKVVLRSAGRSCWMLNWIETKDGTDWVSLFRLPCLFFFRYSLSRHRLSLSSEVGMRERKRRETQHYHARSGLSVWRRENHQGRGKTRSTEAIYLRARMRTQAFIRGTLHLHAKSSIPAWQNFIEIQRCAPYFARYFVMMKDILSAGWPVL